MTTGTHSSGLHTQAVPRRTNAVSSLTEPTALRGTWAASRDWSTCGSDGRRFMAAMLRAAPAPPAPVCTVSPSCRRLAVEEPLPSAAAASGGGRTGSSIATTKPPVSMLDALRVDVR